MPMSDRTQTRAQTMVQLTTGLVDLLDRRAHRDGVSRSQVIRDAVEAFLAEDREAEIDRRIIEGYTHMPQGGEFDVDEWGDLGQIATTLAAESFRRLSEEEREAGFEPW